MCFPGAHSAEPQKLNPLSTCQSLRKLTIAVYRFPLHPLLQMLHEPHACLFMSLVTDLFVYKL